MAKYDSQLTELKTLLPTAKNILIALPANANIDQLAAGLALFLTLEQAPAPSGAGQAGKQVSVVCETDIKVSEAHLFGVDHVQKTLPPTNGGNLTLTLEGVAASDGTVPALEKLDWSAQGGNLNLVFHVLSGQTFQPAKIVPHYQGSGFNLIFTVGANNLNSLGNIYNSSPQAFSGTHAVNVDNQASNTSFAATNVLDTNASSVSEVMSSIITDLGFTLTQDCASNLLIGIFDATNNLTNEKTTAEAYLAVANCLRAGGRKPSSSVPSQTTPSFDWSALMPRDQVAATPVPQAPAPSGAGPIDVGDDHSQPVQIPQPSPEERPAGEGVVSETVEPEWLTPKIFKGSSLG